MTPRLTTRRRRTPDGDVWTWRLTAVVHGASIEAVGTKAAFSHAEAQEQAAALCAALGIVLLPAGVWVARLDAVLAEHPERVALVAPTGCEPAEGWGR